MSGIIREHEIRKIIEENNEKLISMNRQAVIDSIRVNMPAMPQPNTHQIARLTVIIEGLSREVAGLKAEIAASVSSKPKATLSPEEAATLRDVAMDAKKAAESKAATETEPTAPTAAPAQESVREPAPAAPKVRKPRKPKAEPAASKANPKAEPKAKKAKAKKAESSKETVVS